MITTESLDSHRYALGLEKINDLLEKFAHLSVIDFQGLQDTIQDLSHSVTSPPNDLSKNFNSAKLSKKQAPAIKDWIRDLIPFDNNRSFRRTFSESCSTSKPDVVKGILKYPLGWPYRRRAVSETVDLECENLTSTLSADALSSLDSLCDQICCEDANTLHREDKPRKCVRFDENVSKATFRVGSCITSRHKKNKKRTFRRHKSLLEKQTSNHLNDTNTGDTPSDQTSVISKSLHTVKQSVNLDKTLLKQDSGYDSEVSTAESTDNLDQVVTNSCSGSGRRRQVNDNKSSTKNGSKSRRRRRHPTYHK